MNTKVNTHKEVHKLTDSQMKVLEFRMGCVRTVGSICTIINVLLTLYLTFNMTTLRQPNVGTTQPTTVTRQAP